MNLQQNVALSDYSTMRLGGTGAYLVEVSNRPELEQAMAWIKQSGMPYLMIGGGSNIVWRDEGFQGMIIVNRFLQYEDFAEDEVEHYVTIGAGENWDSAVARTVESGLTGIEALSLVPGTTGATPVQNVGAYGQDISQTLVSLEAYDTQDDKFINIPAMDCEFGYRTSRFKTTDRGRFLITAITVHLRKANPEPPFYGSLQRYLDERNIHEYTPQIIRDAVIDIRSQKLPDPAVIANNGSFFANPIVDEGTFTQIEANFPDVPH
jgi:UDP-N-acetylmuramate dehydrogenase